MIKSHNFAHMSTSNTTTHSRLEVWIVRARPLARKVTSRCFECPRKYIVFLSQREGELPEEKMYIGHPPFTLTAIDFLGPYKVKAMNNVRSQIKFWPVVFGCLNTGAVHIMLNKN